MCTVCVGCVCGCVGVWLCECVGVGVGKFGFVGGWVECVGVWVCGYVGVWLCVGVLVCEDMDVRGYGCGCMWV